MLHNGDSTASVLSRLRIEEWIQEARAGSVSAMGHLIQTCRQYLLTVAHRELPLELRAKIAPSDLVQDTACEAQQSFDQFNGERQDEFLAWLRSILLNNVSNARRHYRDTAKRQISREVSLDDGGRWFPGNLVAKESPPADARAYRSL